MKTTCNLRCKTCASFVKHWDDEDGVWRDARRANPAGFELEDVVAASDDVTFDFANPTKTPTLGPIPATELIAELKKRDVVLAEDMDDDALMGVAQSGGIWPLMDARPARPIHELRRHATGSSIDVHCHEDKKKPSAKHCGDEVGADILEVLPCHMRKRAKIAKTLHFKPRAMTDCALWGHS